MLAVQSLEYGRSQAEKRQKTGKRVDLSPQTGEGQKGKVVDVVAQQMGLEHTSVDNSQRNAQL